MATNKVKETKTPKACVPPNSEAVNMVKPKNKIMEVYIMLTPVSLIEISTESEILLVTVNAEGKPIRIPDVLNKFLN